MNKPIQVWKFYEAPDELKSLSDHGGDEDWVFLIPPHYTDNYISWLSENVLICVSEFAHPTLEGWRVIISAHA